jgi:ATP/maltotriose-dependent transcriptional regulator MalT
VPLAIGNYLADLAWLEVDANRPGPAAQRAQEAIAVFNSAGDERSAAYAEAVLAWTDARQGNGDAARRRLAALRKTAEEDEGALFTILGVEARVAGALGDWDRAIELLRETVRMASEWNSDGLRITQQAHLAEAFHGAGDRRALEKLVHEILPEVERNGLRGVSRDLRALLE